jgi:hypothetical protein
MVRSEWRITTEWSSRRLHQICTHFACQTVAVHSPLRGHIVFPFGSCRLEASDHLLVMTIEADDAAALARLEGLLAHRLVRLTLADRPEVSWPGLEGLKF